MTKQFTLLITFLLVSMLAVAQQRLVSGTVKDNRGAGVPGATVQVKGQTKGVAADKDG
ncbi:MAG TPA: hypothetical protein VGC22_03295 [Chitinophaga sp.]